MEKDSTNRIHVASPWCSRCKKYIGKADTCPHCKNSKNGTKKTNKKLIKALLELYELYLDEIYEEKEPEDFYHHEPIFIPL